MRIETSSVVSRIVAGVITIIFAVFLNWLCLPAWNIRSGGFWWYWIVVGIFAVISFGIADYVIEDTSIPSGIIALIVATIVFCIAYCLISLLLAYKYAPKTFKLRV